MPPLAFTTRLVRPVGVGTWTFAPIPKELASRTGLRSHQRVKGSVDGAPFSSSLMPRGGGIFFLVVNAALREQIGKHEGDAVSVRLEIDTAPVKVVLPADLRRALAGDAKARRAFGSLAPSHRKAFATWVGSAKQEETRRRRAAKALTMLHEGRTLN